jgi:hypothetical protein
MRTIARSWERRARRDEGEEEEEDKEEEDDDEDEDEAGQEITARVWRAPGPVVLTCRWRSGLITFRRCSCSTPRRVGDDELSRLFLEIQAFLRVELLPMND